MEELKLERIIEEYETQDDQIESFPYETLHSITGGFRRRIGKGGFAEVFLGTTIPNGHMVAIKNMKIGISKAEPENELLRKNFDFEGIVY